MKVSLNLHDLFELEADCDVHVVGWFDNDDDNEPNEKSDFITHFEIESITDANNKELTEKQIKGLMDFLDINQKELNNRVKTGLPFVNMSDD